MHSQIEKTLNVVADLDSWDVGAVAGGMNYLLLQSAINTVVRMLPDQPEEGSGLEQFTEWEAKMRNPEIQEKVAPIIGTAERVCDVLEEYSSAPVADFQSVLEFMTSRPPQKSSFEAEYNNRKRMGMKPGMPLKQFVDLEYQVALTRHQNLIAKGEAAVLALQRIVGSDGDLPEWLLEALNAKALQKLEQRWMRAELRRTNPKIGKQDRDLAEANQKLIEAAIVELGGEVPKDTSVEDKDEDLDDFIKKVEGIAAK